MPFVICHVDMQIEIHEWCQRSRKPEVNAAVQSLGSPGLMGRELVLELEGCRFKSQITHV